MSKECPIPAPSRRRLLLAGGGLCLAGLPRLATAGGQIEEPLIDSVRSALSASIANTAPPKPIFVSDQSRQQYQVWIREMSERLERWKPNALTRIEFLETLWYESKRAGLEPAMVLGVVQVESAFRKYAISIAGARGYMQVMPFWSRLIGDGEPSRLFHLQTNLRFGCVILRHYLDIERGDLFMALGRYNGSRGRAEYPDLVFAAQRRWESASRA
ncbi:lytic transglycosylase domain-containing protein [Piscinibacter sakaiensis]|uniref:lytic transglycosylase domain-containing protein n=1 Tax=Piscinibacter sakaiensis TaxID=1547922 RepID=UPI003AAD6D77